MASVERVPSNVLSNSILSVVDRLEIRAITESGCGPLEGPLVALNWFSIRDREAFERYAPIATSVLIDHGHRTILESHRVETFEAPPGTPSTGGAFVHGELVLARYRSAGSFLDMILSPEFVNLLPDPR